MNFKWRIETNHPETRWTCDGCWYKCGITSLLQPSVCLVQETRFWAREMRSHKNDLSRQCSVLTYIDKGVD